MEWNKEERDRYLSEMVNNGGYDDGLSNRIRNAKHLFFCNTCGVRMLYDSRLAEVYCPRCHESLDIKRKLQLVEESKQLNLCRMCKKVLPVEKLLFRDSPNGRPRMWRGVCSNCADIATYSVELWLSGISARKVEAITYDRFGISPHYNTICFLAGNEEFMTRVDWGRVAVYGEEYRKYKEKIRREYSRLQREDRFRQISERYQAAWKSRPAKSIKIHSHPRPV